MADDHTVSAEQERASAFVGRSHLVVLGAGASRAAFPRGDKNGKKLPLMVDFVDVLNLRPLLNDWGVNPDRNFEEIFSQIYAAGDDKRIEALQRTVEEYFGSLEITDEPTVYDHLLIGLREKDFIASFNWDPLLIQAYRRSAYGVGLPRMIFLHGNVASGYCADDQVVGSAGANCRHCGRPFARTPLLYPINKKNYAANEFIASEWSAFKKILSHTFMVTIFGYSGPKSDQEALDAMADAWGPTENRELEQTCFITIQSEKEVKRNFGRFIHTHHFEMSSDFYSSWIANHPRRTGEAWWNQYLEAKFIEDNPIPRHADFHELRDWLQPFRKPEQLFAQRNAKL